ncbi:HD domain-containing protein [bacterium]|nr:HD domain-containing protein [bacterium]
MTTLQESIIEQTSSYVRSQLDGEGTGHDWWHIERVLKNAIHIGQKEGADLFIVQLAALLHDIADHKFHGGDDTVGPKVARQWLQSINVEANTIEHVCRIVKDISFKGADVTTAMHSLEGKVVQDADRLDAIGAIGIARAFAYGGFKQRELYNPSVKPERHDNFDAYKNSRAPTINHFYEKLLLLKDRMNTATGKAMAEERHRFMEMYLDRFFKEWEGIE